MPKQQIVVIGDEDAVFGLGLIGFKGYPARNVEQARLALREAMADPATALILLTEDLAEARQEAVSESSALVVEIPGPGPAELSGALEERIERALGVRLAG